MGLPCVIEVVVTHPLCVGVLHEEGVRRLLVGGDRTVGVREGGLEMREDLRRRRPARGFRRQRGRRATPKQRRADVALALVEPLPEALQGSVAQRTVGGADRGGDGAGDGASEELPQTTGCQAQPPDFVGAPDAESPSATVTPIAVAAKDSPCAHRFSLGAALVKSVQKAVPNQRANPLAMRARRQLEPLGDRDPFLLAAVKPSLLAHVRPMPPKITDSTGAKQCGVEAGYDSNPESAGSGERGTHPERLAPPRPSFAKFPV